MAIWNNLNISSYSYTYQKSCFCLQHENIVITVTNGSIAEAFYTPSGTYLTNEEIKQLFTIEGFFQEIQHAITEEYEKISVTYEQEHGYPTSIYLNSNLSVPDGGVEHYIIDLQ